MWAAIASAIGAVLGPLVDALPYLCAYLAGTETSKRTRYEHQAETKTRQLRIAARRRATRSDVLERMRDNQL